MAKPQKNQGQNLFKSVILAYFILILHVALIAGLGVLVLFFRGVVNYMMGIFIVGTAAILVSGYLFYRRMKAEGKTLREMLNSPLFNGKSVEISLLGGLASFRVGKQDDFRSLPGGTTDVSRQLEDPRTARMRELTELARLFENNLITLEEFNRAKQDIFKP